MTHNNDASAADVPASPVGVAESFPTLSLSQTNETAPDLPGGDEEPSPVGTGVMSTAEIDSAESSKKQDEVDAATDATVESEKPAEEESSNVQVVAPSSGIVVSSSKKSRPPYKYDPDKITLRFLFANRDGLTVTVECKPSDTVAEVKGALISVWPKGTRLCSHNTSATISFTGSDRTT
jgi:hypothetical protein